MRRVRVVTDSTADMGESEVERLGITVVPLNVHWNGATYQDKTEITIDEFYRKLREEKGTPRTSQPSVGQFEEAYRRLLEDAESVISLHISGKLSGTLNSAQLAARNVGPERIAVVDTLTTSHSLGMAVQRVARLAEKGADLAQCLALANDLVPRLKVLVGIDTVEFLRRGGRIGRAQAIAANLLNIKLVFEIAEGEVVPLDRVRTRAATVKRLAEAVRDLGPVEELAVVYGDDCEPADQLLTLIEHLCPRSKISRERIGPVLGTHTGPGVFGVCAILAK